MKLLLIIVTLLLCIPMHISAGIRTILNPTKFWEMRDSLQVLESEGAHTDGVERILKEVPEFNAFLSRVKDVIPFPNLRIDIVESACPPRAINLKEIKKLLDTHGYDVVGTDCEGNRTIASHIANDVRRKLIPVENPFLMEFIDTYDSATDSRLKYIVRLCKMVQCELALATLAYELKEYRNAFGNPNTSVSGLLVINGYVDESHLKTILRLVRAQTNLK